MTSRCKKVAVISALCLLILVLGLALGLTIGKRDSEVHYRYPSVFPLGGLDDSKDGLLQSGAYYTSSDTESLFLWNQSSVKLDRGINGTDLIVNSSQQFQLIDGYGASLTDSASYLLNDVKKTNQSLYDQLLNFSFNRRTGMAVMRLPLGSSDFSLEEYVFSKSKSSDPVSKVVTDFDFNPPSYTSSLLRDIMSKNPNIKIALCPWSPPAALKTSASLNGGQLKDEVAALQLLAEYYAQCIRAFFLQGIHIWAFSMQNEPSHNASYPSMLLDGSSQSKLAAILRGRLAELGFSSVKLLLHEDNFDSATDAVDMIQMNSTAVDGASFHCYKGEPSDINEYNNKMRQANMEDKELHMTECSGVGETTDTNFDSPDAINRRWTGMSWWLSNIFFPLTSLEFRSVILWNIALDRDSGPHLESAYCKNCTGPYTISTHKTQMDRHVNLNLQTYILQHFSGASSDLSWLGGTQASRVNVSRSSTSTLTDKQYSCLQTQGFAASIEIGLRTRYGLVLANTCGYPLITKIQFGNDKIAYRTYPGLHTIIWIS